MTDTPETQPVEGAEILKLLRKLDAQSRANGEALSKLAEGLKDVRTYVGDLSAAGAAQTAHMDEMNQHLGAIGKVVAEAAPLLQSGPARALASGRKVADYLKGGRRG